MSAAPLDLFEYEAAAKATLPRAEYDNIAGGATDEITLRRTRAVLDDLLLRPRVLRGLAETDLSLTVLGQRIAFPVMISPAGGHQRAHPDGELATARAARAAGTAVVLSSRSTYTLEDVARAGGAPLWFQTYIYSDREHTLHFVRRAEDAGYGAICLTLDTAVRAKRERDLRNGYRGPPTPNYDDLREQLGVVEHEATRERDFVSSLIDRGASWSDVAWVAERTRLPVLVKGIMCAEDAALAVESGARAIVVSDHGGRQLDTTMTTLEALPECVAAAAGRAEVYLDGGIRRGTDVVKALALGARAVLIARPVFWGLAVAGQAGVAGVLAILRDELAIALAMCGHARPHSVGRDVLASRPRLAPEASS